MPPIRVRLYRLGRTLLVTGEWAGLWTDGRYFLQAAAQLAGSGIELMKMNHAGVPALEVWLEQNLAAGSTVGFDGRIVDLACGRRLEKTFRLKYDEDLVGEIWLTRPKLCGNRIWALPQSATGESSEASWKGCAGPWRKRVRIII